MTTVSIIMPIYNVEKYVRKAVESVIMQTFKDFELIIVNDGSSDRSINIVERMALLDPRIKIIHQQNRGLSAARNTGLRAASGEYVCFVDSDDEVDNDFLKKTMMSIEMSFPDVLMYGIYLDKIGSREEILATRAIKIPETDYKKNELKNFIIDKTSLDLMGYVTNKLYKRSIIEKYKIEFNEDTYYLEDMEFNQKVFKMIETLKILENCFYHYKLRTRRSLITTYQTKHFEWQMSAIKSRKEVFENWGIDQNEIKSSLAYLQLLAIRSSCSLLFKHTHNLTFVDKSLILKSMLHDPLTMSRVKHFTPSTMVDRILKEVVKGEWAYSLAAISVLYAYLYNQLTTIHLIIYRFKQRLNNFIIKNKYEKEIYDESQS